MRANSGNGLAVKRQKRVCSLFNNKTEADESSKTFQSWSAQSGHVKSEKKVAGAPETLIKQPNWITRTLCARLLRERRLRESDYEKTA